MIKKVLILLVFVLGLIPAAALAQGAEARMRVSVEVVKGSSVELSRPNQIFLKENEETSLGMLTLKGVEMQNVMIRTDKNVILHDKSGNEITMDILSKTEKDSDGSELIEYKGKTGESLLSSAYTGRLETTIEYY